MELCYRLGDHLVLSVCKSSVNCLRIVCGGACKSSVGVRPAPVYACHKFAVTVFLIASKTHLNAF